MCRVLVSSSDVRAGCKKMRHECYLEPPFFAPPLRARVLADFFAETDFAAAGRAAAALPPRSPPFFAGALFSALPRPDPLFLPPPEILLTVAHARRSASSSDAPRSS